jgi:hypothetical protein
LHRFPATGSVNYCLAESLPEYRYAQSEIIVL